MQTQKYYQRISILFVSILLVVLVEMFLIATARCAFAESSEESVKALMGIIEDRHEDWRLRIKAIKLIAGVDDPAVANLLIRVFNDAFLTYDCPALKWNVVVALGNFGKYPDVIDALIKGLSDDVLYIREAAIQSLGQIGSIKAVPFLLPALNDRSFAIRISAVKALEKLGDNKAVPYLKEVAANDADQYIKDEAKKALRTLLE